MSQSPALSIAMTMGDPAGVGPQIAWRAWNALRSDPRLSFFVIGGEHALKRGAEAAGLHPAIQRIESPEAAKAAFPLGLPILSIECPTVLPGKPDRESAPAIVRSIRLATELVRSGRASAVVTNPISKALLYASGFPHPGHTEFLASLASEPGQPAVHPVMLLVGGGLRVALATIHIPLASVPGSLSTPLLVETGRILDRALRTDFGIPSPRIGMCGLNPHAGEAGEIGREEIEVVNPASEILRQDGVDVSNARPGDVVFHEALSGSFDAVLALYHDQGLIPVKTLDLWGGVNVTLGLPFVRTSPDHGTAYDAAAQGAGRAESLIAAVRLAAEMSARRHAQETP